MGPMMDIKRTAAVWSVSERRVNELCRNGRIEGAVKVEGRWMIPVNTDKPTDKRYTKQPLTTVSGIRKLPVPVGVSDYRKLSEEYYFVDKTLLIRDVIDEKPRAILFTRPRSFGKSVNLDMLKTFFELTGEDTTKYFKNRKIWYAGEEYRARQGRYPVIFFDFSSLDYDSFTKLYIHLSQMIAGEYKRYEGLLAESVLTNADREYFKRILDNPGNEADIRDSLMMLSRMLHEYYQNEAVIIIDEFDIPIINSAKYGYKDEAVALFNSLYSYALNGNRHLAYCFMTGVLPGDGTGVFNGIGCLRYNTVLDSRYSEYFGFTQDEVREMIDYYNVPDKEELINSWYGFYRFGSTDVFNPWSIVNFFASDCRPLAFWETTGNNDAVNSFLQEGSLDMLETIMQGKSFSTRIFTNACRPGDGCEADQIYSYLLAEGYLKAVHSELMFDGGYLCDIAIPDREISYIYGKKILAQFEPTLTRRIVNGVRESLIRTDIKELKEALTELIRRTIVFNTEGHKDVFYHGMVLSMISLLGTRYYMAAEKEDSEGGFSIEMMPLEARLPGILIMIKSAPSGSYEQLAMLARFACKQISNRQYDNDAKSRYVSRALKFGAAYKDDMISVITE